MSTTIRKGLLGKEDTRFYTAASPTFSRLTSYGNSTTVTAIAATHIPLVQGAASLYWTQNTVQRAISEGISRYFAIEHSIATYAGGGVVGDHKKVFGFYNASSATSIQAAASNSYLRDGVARVIIKNGTTTCATPIQLPRKTMLIGQNRGTIVRASSTIQTSRVFSISGTAGATNTTLNAAATVNTNLAPFSSSAGFAVNSWFFVQRSTLMEQHQIRSIAGNAITTQEPFMNRFASGATVKIIYPAELYLDNMDIQLTSGTQGFGVAATYLVQSYLGPNCRITGAARAGVLLTRSSYNRSESAILNPKTVTAGFGYGVRMKDGSNKNEIDGIRAGVTKECADGGSVGNQLVGRMFRMSAAASFNASATRQYSVDPFAYIMRMRKPEMSYAAYNPGTATVVVSCPAGVQNPAEVYINGNIYRNTGTILCDLSRTKTPAAGTVGGLDRGPATATRAYHMYAVPTLTATATRQWDLIASSQSPATGPLASATFPNWSWLGAVNTGATVRLVPFVQHGDQFHLNRNRTVVTVNSPIAAYATYKQVPISAIPIGADQVFITGILASTGSLTSHQNGDVLFAHGDETNVTSYSDLMNFPLISFGAAWRNRCHTKAWVPVNSNRLFAYLLNANATSQLNIIYHGYKLKRASFK